MQANNNNNIFDNMSREELLSVLANGNNSNGRNGARAGGVPIAIPMNNNSNNSVTIPGQQYAAMMALIGKITEEQASLSSRIEQGEQQSQQVASQVGIIADSVAHAGQTPEDDSDEWDKPEAVKRFVVSTIQSYILNK